MSARLDGKVALITGAASGIGLATAHRFAQEGAQLVLTDPDQPALAAALAQIDKISDGHRAIVLDVTQQTQWIAALETVEHCLAGSTCWSTMPASGRFCSIADTTLDEWRATMAVNLDSVFLGTKHAMPLLARSGRGVIVNMSSMRGIAAATNCAAYCAAKAGARLFTKATALECAAARNRVRANSIHPGHVVTPLTAAYAHPAIEAALLAHTPLQRFAQAGEIAAAIVFLSSDESSYMTGSELTVDGGITAQ